MRIAISGASGFIGQHVVKQLQSSGVDVIAISRQARQKNSGPTVTPINMDISCPPENPFDAMGRPDALIHLAWGGLPNYQSDHHVNVELPTQLAFLESCINGGLKKLIVTGSCYEYGLASGELSEDTPTRPCTRYGLAKNMLRQALFDLRCKHEFDLAWLRLFYLYGSGQAKQSLFGALHSAIQSGSKVFDMSGGEQLRDFLPVDEAARLIAEVAQTEHMDGIYNVCSSTPVAVKDLARLWVEASGAEIILNLGKLPYSAHETMGFWGNRQKLDTLLGSQRPSNQTKN